MLRAVALHVGAPTATGWAPPTVSTHCTSLLPSYSYQLRSDVPGVSLARASRL